MKETLKDLLTDVWNVPNVLTMIRLALVPVFAGALMAGHTVQALIIFCIASFTDALDGFIARKWQLITSFGKLMDPMADKLLVCTALICQVIRDVFPWPAMAIVGLKELYMVIGSTYMLKSGIVVSANYWGKTSTVLFMLSLILSFFHAELESAGLALDIIILWISVILGLCAAVSYTVRGKRKLDAQK